MNENAFSIGVDIGGTFTDVLNATTGGSLYRTKVPSTPEAFERGIIVERRCMAIDTLMLGKRRGSSNAMHQLHPIAQHLHIPIII